MAIHGTDDRTRVTDFTTAGNNSIVSVDSLITAPTNALAQDPENLVGSGIQIADNFVLTAGHVVFRPTGTVAAGRVTNGADVGALATRPSTKLTPTDVNFTSADITYPDNYQTAAGFARDIALIKTSGAIGATNIGMVVYLDYVDAKGIAITTSGFPAAYDAPGTVTTTPQDPVHTYLNQATQAYTSSGTVTSTSADGRFGYSNSTDTEGGQSGSGVWTMVDDGTGTQVAAVVGVHTNSGNGGHLITDNEYRAITDAMDGNAGAASTLPTSFIFGTEASIFSNIPLIGGLFASGDDIVQGSFLNERIVGFGGDDRVEGRGGDDRIEGGAGVDHARFSGNIADYDITIVDASTIKVDHARGTKKDGVDTLIDTEFAVFNFEDAQKRGETGFGQDDDGSLFYVPLLRDADDPTKLRDGPNVKVKQDVKDANDDLIGSMSVELPAFTFDGDICYNLNLGAQNSVLYNFAYIVDSSGSMGGSRITQTKAAYASLTQSLIDQGVAARSQFSVVDFDSSATLFSGLDAAGAIATVNSLVAGGGTNFGPALVQAENWFESLSNLQNATNIAYFLSDGAGSGASTALQTVNEGATPVTVDVRAFGIGSGANTTSLGIIDSNSATILNNASDLIDAFAVSGVDRSKVDRIDVLLNGVVVDTIAPNQLVDGPLGLTFKGTVDNIPVVLGADQTLKFDLIFNDGTPPAAISTRLSDGQSEVRQASPDGNSQIVSMSVVQSDYVITGTAEVVNGNNLDNTIEINSGSHEVNGNEGDDRFIVKAGSAVINGGIGTDTVVFETTRAEAGQITATGGVVSVGPSYTLLDVEFIEFTDARIEVATLAELAEVSVSSKAIVINEGDAGTKMAEVTLSLSTPLSSALVVDFQTSDGSATQGTDYTASNGSVTFAAGETSKVISFQVIDDMDIEQLEQFNVALTISSGSGQFKNGTTSDAVSVGIENDDTAPGLSIDGNTVQGDNGDNTLVSFTGGNTIIGDGGSDYLAGGFMADNLSGGASNDVLRGDAGNLFGGSDILAGGADDDFLMGGRGADTFVFNTNEGNDTIGSFNVADMTYDPLTGYDATATGADFQSGIDDIHLTGFNTVNAGNVMSMISDTADGALFNAEGSSILFYGLTASQLAVDDFQFV